MWLVVWHSSLSVTRSFPSIVAGTNAYFGLPPTESVDAYIGNAITHKMAFVRGKI